MTARTSAAAGPGLGSGTATLANFSDDEVGELTLVAAGTPGAVDSIVAQVVLSGSWSGYAGRPAPLVALVPTNKTAARVGQWDFTLDGALKNLYVYCSAVLTAGATYKLRYELRG